MNANKQYISMAHEFEQKLNRNLNDKELEFIKWVGKQQTESKDLTSDTTTS